MSSNRYSSQSRRDLQGIVDLIAARRPKAAAKLLAKIEKTVKLLETMPTLGSLCPQLPVQGMRSFTVARKYVIYYLTEPKPIHVLRVVSGHRDAKELEME